MHEGQGFFNQKLLVKAYFSVKMTGPAIVRPVNFDFWKAPLVYLHAVLIQRFYCSNVLQLEN